MNQLTPYTPSPLAVTDEEIDEAIRKDPRLKSKHSTTQYKSDLLKFESWRTGRDITKSLVEDYASYLQRAGYAPATINQNLAAIRWWARRVTDFIEDYASGEAAALIAKQAARVLTVRNVENNEEEQRGRHLDIEELAALLAACDADPSPAGRRDKAIVWLAYSNGLRRQTLCDLDLANLELTEQGAKIRYTSKRKKKGYAHLMGDAWQAMREWLDLRGNEPGPIFVQVNKSDRIVIPEQPLSGEAIRKWLKVRFLESGLEKNMTWHTFRYTFAGNLLDEGYDISTVQALMLHASPAQTAKYDRRKERHQQEAILSISNLGEDHAPTNL